MAINSATAAAQQVTTRHILPDLNVQPSKRALADKISNDLQCCTDSVINQSFLSFTFGLVHLQSEEILS